MKLGFQVQAYQKTVGKKCNLVINHVSCVFEARGEDDAITWFICKIYCGDCMIGLLGTENLWTKLMN